MLRQEYDQAEQLFGAQPLLTQRFIEAQAQHMAEAIVQHISPMHFTLPAQIVTPREQQPAIVPSADREQTVGTSKVLDRLARADVHKLLRQ
ncbi:MAG TPA: hypothetical protein VMP08_03250, partial [Anaerolineae bacterium]|nr:hypothetical protein [Anaerolineae bacterium]